MTIPKQAIEKAMEGGYKVFGGNPSGQPNFQFMQEHWAGIALDPTFWVALGKALGWREEEWHPTRTHPDGESRTWAGYLPHALRFYERVLTGGDTKAFWDELLTSH